MRAFLRPRNWAKTKRSYARVEVFFERDRWYAVASGQRVSELVQVRGGTLVSVGGSVGEAVEEVAGLIGELERLAAPDTTSRPW